MHLLGDGGNADVYEAETDSGSRVALKILRNRRRESEPFRRFRREVEKHFELSRRRIEGILPLLAFEIPDVPDINHPAWLAMPVAQPIEAALGESPELEQVAQALADIASTVAKLHEENVAHRDIKPTNLYLYDGKWVVSDFGLVAVPEGDALTVGAKALGPWNFIAPEMVLRPEVADGRSADVYSIGKTLWCLVCGQRIPPLGEHRRDLEWKRLKYWGVSHPRAFYLDNLIEQACRELPSERPSMRAFSDTLRGWALPAEHPRTSESPNLKDVVAEIGDVFARDQSDVDRRKRRQTDLENVVERLAKCLGPMVDQFGSSLAVSSEHHMIAEALRGFADRLLGIDRIAAWRSVGLERNTGRDSRYAFLRSGVAAALATDQSVVIGAAHALRHSGGFETIWKDVSPPVLLGSLDLDAEINRLSEGFVAAISRVLERYVEAIR